MGNGFFPAHAECADNRRTVAAADLRVPRPVRLRTEADAPDQGVVGLFDSIGADVGGMGLSGAFVGQGDFFARALAGQVCPFLP